LSSNNDEAKKVKAFQENDNKDIGGLIFVAFMFIGGGLGLLFGRPDVGGAIGMGVGFIAMAFFKAKKIEVTKSVVTIPRTFGQVSLIIIGLISISAGILILYAPELLYPYLAGIVAIVIGLLFIIVGLTGFKRS